MLLVALARWKSSVRTPLAPSAVSNLKRFRRCRIKGKDRLFF